MWREHSDGPPVQSRYDSRPWRLATQAEFDREFANVEHQNPERYRRHAFQSSLFDSRNGNIFTYWRND